MKIAAIIPTYQRPKDLERCLEAFKRQTRPVDQLFVTVRDTDAETWTFLQSYNAELLPLQALIVKVPGVVAAMNCGLDAATGDIIAFTDDDAAPHADWLERIETYFLKDEKIGGVGGRDWQYVGTEIKEVGERKVVGQMRWHGMVIGNHHLGVGEPQEVYVLKGVNMSFRRDAIAELRFDERMRGTGAQVHFELAFSLRLKQAGWKIIFDPKVAVDHFPAQRFDEDLREKFSAIALENQVHNETLALLDYLSPIRRIVFLLVATIISFLKWLQLLPREGVLSNEKFLASLRGRWQGVQTWNQGRK
ncbi:glycosyltransferase [Tumidithrix elongata RA019]|uniref:Glycosyltransferase n=1 Tax=Tumidithrix elongata BACA0141 TaxID=2716417 RepID=A0AAW9Q189_9CYAN|nr:glycosyltransferase [Tumidithrix elongata RA019]